MDQRDFRAINTLRKNNPVQQLINLIFQRLQFMVFTKAHNFWLNEMTANYFRFAQTRQFQHVDYLNGRAHQNFD